MSTECDQLNMPKWVYRKIYTLMLVTYIQDNDNLSAPRVFGSSRKYVETHLKFQPEQAWILLGCKQRGFGNGLWSGFGGKMQSDDANPKMAALREMHEESGLLLNESEVEEVGRFWSTFEDKAECMEVYLFICRNWRPRRHENGQLDWPTNTEEMHPCWFPIGSPSHLDLSQLPFDAMWPNDSLWFGHVLSQRWVLAWFHMKLGLDGEAQSEARQIDSFELSKAHMEMYCTNKSASSQFARLIDRLDLIGDESIQRWIAQIGNCAGQSKLSGDDEFARVVEVCNYP